MLASSCSTKDSEVLVAKVYEKSLTMNDLNSVLPAGLSTMDSAKKADLYVHQWMREQVVLQQARLNLDIDKSTYAKKLESYENELIIYDYQNQLIQQKLNTEVTEEDKREYYNKYKGNFVQKTSVARVRFAIFKEGTKELRQFGKWLKENEELENVKNFAIDMSENFDVNGERWYGLDELKELLPISEQNLLNIVKEKGYRYVKSKGKEYFVKVLEYRMEGDVAPFEIVNGKIKSTLMNHRKTELLKNMREDLFNQANDKGELEIFK